MYDTLKATTNESPSLVGKNRYKVTQKQIGTVTFRHSPFIRSQAEDKQLSTHSWIDFIYMLIYISFVLL